MSEDHLALRYIDRDAPCRRCGYNLRGIPELGRCPECHAPVILALMPEDVAAIDPEWIERIARGCRLATWSVYVFLISFSAMAAIGVVSFWFPLLHIKGDTVALAWAFLGGACLLIAALGLWIATQPHPTFAETGRPISPRQISRLCLAAFPLTIAATWATRILVGWNAMTLPVGLGSPLGLMGLLGFWSFANYVEAVGRLIGDPSSTEKAPWYRKGFAFGWIVGWVGVIGSMTGSGFGFILAALFGGCMMFGYSFLAIGLTSYLNDALPGYLSATRANWEKAESEAKS